MSIIDGLRDRVNELERAVGTARATEGAGAGRLRAELAAVRVTQEELRRDLDRLAAEVKQALTGVTAAVAGGAGAGNVGGARAAKTAAPVKTSGTPGAPARNAGGAGTPVKT